MKQMIIESPGASTGKFVAPNVVIDADVVEAIRQATSEELPVDSACEVFGVRVFDYLKALHKRYDVKSYIGNAIVFYAICSEIQVQPIGLNRICDEIGADPRDFFTFMQRHEDGPYRKCYYDAKERQIDAMGEEIVNIAYDAAADTYEVRDKSGNVKTKTDWEVVGRSELKIKTLQWIMSKLNPRKYGNKVETQLTGKDGEAFTINFNVPRAGAAVGGPDPATATPLPQNKFKPPSKNSEISAKWTICQQIERTKGDHGDD